ncbi:MAG: hypothetical protein AAFW95_13210, partial [Cyanobacteria bacterium J06638_6]
IAQLTLKRYRYRKAPVSSGGYTSTPKTVSWSELICRDRHHKTLAALNLVYADAKLLRRISSYVGLEVTVED